MFGATNILGDVHAFIRLWFEILRQYLNFELKGLKPFGKLPYNFFNTFFDNTSVTYRFPTWVVPLLLFYGFQS